MSTNKKRIIVALDDMYIQRLNDLCTRFKTKQYSKVIKYLLDLIEIKI